MNCDKSDAWLDGWFAHRNGVTNEEENNPFTERRQNRSNLQWLAGWCARFSAVKHGGSLEYDDVLY